MDQIVRKLGPEDRLAPPPAEGEQDPRVGIEIHVRAEAVERLRKRAVVHGRGTPYEIYCDEAVSLGGDDSAPPPLSYFSAAIAF